MARPNPFSAAATRLSKPVELSSPAVPAAGFSRPATTDRNAAEALARLQPPCFHTVGVNDLCP